MITNKDLSIDRENGKITLNGNKYDLGTQGEIDAVVKDVYSVMGQNGAKNLIPYPYNGTTQVDHGVTFTVDNDGTVIANGTANGIAQLYLVLGDVALSAAGNLVINTNKPLFLSGCPSGGGNTTYRIQYGLTDGTTYWAKTASDTGRGVKITPVDGLNSYCFVVIKIMVFDGYTANNLTFKPMLRLASDTDNTYHPYAKTNKQLTETIGDITQTGITGADVAAQLGALETAISDVDAYTVSDITDLNQSITVNEFSLRKCGKIVTIGLNFNASDAIAQFTNLFKLPSGIESFGRIDAVGIFATSTPNIARLTVDDNGYVVANSAIAAASYYLGAIVFICDED